MKLLTGTFNILHGKDYPYYLETKEERIDLITLAGHIRSLELDICGLNEVRNQENVAGLCNQAKVIAEELGYNYVFGKAINYRGGEYGNALLTKHTILSSRVIPIVVPTEERIEGQAYEDRAILCADLLVEGQMMTVMVSHFGLHADEMQKAVESVEAFLQNCTNPVILMGDLNFGEESEFYTALCGMLKDSNDVAQGSTLTFPSPNPDRKIDYVFYNQGLEAVKAWVPDVVFSDHRPFVAELKFI